MSITKTFECELDSWIWLFTPDSNQGGANTLSVSDDLSALGEARAIVQFDTTSGFGPEVFILEALLKQRVNVAPATKLTLRLFEITQAMVELEVTWNRYNAANLWTLAGGDFKSDVFDEYSVDTGSTGDFLSDSIVNIVRQAHAETAGIIRALITSRNSDDSTYALEGRLAVTEADRPKLEVEYVELDAAGQDAHDIIAVSSGGEGNLFMVMVTGEPADRWLRTGQRIRIAGMAGGLSEDPRDAHYLIQQRASSQVWITTQPWTSNFTGSVGGRWQLIGRNQGGAQRRARNRG